MKRYAIYSTSFLALLACIVVGLPHSASAQEKANASLSVGAIRDHLETSTVRVLAKYGESLAITDRLEPKELSGDRGLFYTISRQISIDATDKGKFGGIILRYGFKRYDVGMKVDPDAPKRPDGKPVIKFDGDKWMHVIPIEFGVDADRNFKNRDYLVEFGYIPALFRAGESCFKLGGNPIVGISGQLGRKIRVADPTAIVQTAESSDTLRRVKIEGKLDFPLSCVFNLPTRSEDSSSKPFDLIFADIGSWQLSAAATRWRDFSEDRNYRKYELNLRIPTGKNASIDLKREIGAAPAHYDTGAKFSANLTVSF